MVTNTCAFLPRNLTRAEWQQYISDALPYQAVCENLPEVSIAEILDQVKAQRWQEVLDLLKQAETNNLPLNPILNNVNILNTLCWNASLDGLATQVLEYCERAVTLAPTDAAIRDSRGLARALTGDYSGAIDDFQFFIDSSSDDNLRQQRQQWIIDLNAEKNPFTPKVLEELKNP